MKAVVKELFIIMLLGLVIILTLRMVIYDFIPSEDIMPDAVIYKQDYSVKAILRDIEKQENSTELLLKTYVIEQSDLKDYVLQNGKTDPFAD